MGFPLLGVVATGRCKLIQRLLNQGVDTNKTNEYEETLLRLSFEQEYFNSEVSHIILRMLIAVGIDINETYEETSFLCLQALEAEACSFSKDHHDER